MCNALRLDYRAQRKRGTVCLHLQAEVRRMNPSNKMNKNSSTLSREAATLSSLLLRVPTLVGPPGLSAKMKVSYVFSLQEKSITLRLFPISCLPAAASAVVLTQGCVNSYILLPPAPNKKQHDIGIMPQR